MKKSDVVKDWLTFGRIHTAALTQGILLLGYFVGGGTLISIGTVEWAALGVLFHYVGFGDNNVIDYLFDVKDEHKKVHPLVRGTIGISRARVVVYIGIGLLALVGFLLTWGGLGYAFLLLAIVFGLLYNRVSKRSVLSPVWISLTFPPLIFVPYFTLREVPSLLLLLAFGYAVGQMLYQIGVEGYMKDIDVDRRNLLKVLGSRYEGGYFMPGGREIFFSSALLWLKGLFGVILLFSSWNIVSLTGFLTCLGGVSYFSFLFDRRGKFDNRLTVRRASIIEILSYFALVFALEPLLGYGVLTFMVVYPLAWFVVWNRIYWSTWIAPRV